MIAAVGLTVCAVLLGPGALWADSHRFEYNGFSAVSSIVHDPIFFSNYSGVNRGSASVYADNSRNQAVKPFSLYLANGHVNTKSTRNITFPVRKVSK